MHSSGRNGPQRTRTGTNGLGIALFEPECTQFDSKSPEMISANEFLLNVHRGGSAAEHGENEVLCSSVQFRAVPCGVQCGQCGVQCGQCKVLCSSVQFSAVPCSSVQFSAAPCGPLGARWRCFGGRCRQVLPISLPKPENGEQSLKIARMRRCGEGLRKNVSQMKLARTQTDPTDLN